MWRTAASCLLACALVFPAAGQEQPSPTPTPPAAEDSETLKNELKETQARLHAFEADNEVLRRQHELTKQSLATLTQTLAEANAEAEFFRRQYAELKLRMEALGLASVGDSNKEALEQRLLKCVRDLALAQQEKDAMGEQLLALSETILRYLKTAGGSADPNTRMDVEAQLRGVNKLLGDRRAATGQTPADLSEGSVISVKREWSLIVANLGSRQGVRLGMPFKVVRGDKLIAQVRAIDVRENITGAVIEEVSSNDAEVKIGDKLRVDTKF